MFLLVSSLRLRKYCWLCRTEVPSKWTPTPCHFTTRMPVRQLLQRPKTKQRSVVNRTQTSTTVRAMYTVVEQKRNVMAHAQKPDLVFQRNGRVHLYRRRCQFSRLLAAEGCASAVVMLDRPCPIQCTTPGYPLHSPFSPSLLHPCVSVCHHIPFLLY